MVRLASMLLVAALVFACATPRKPQGSSRDLRNGMHYTEVQKVLGIDFIPQEAVRTQFGETEVVTWNLCRSLSYGWGANCMRKHDDRVMITFFGQHVQSLSWY